MPLLTRDDIQRQSHFAWACLALLALVACWFWAIDKHNAAMGSLAALAGCLGLILPPRERMTALPWRLRALPRRLDATVVLGTLVVSPGYGLHWFHGANPYDEMVHLLNGTLAGLVFLGLLKADGRARPRARLVLTGAAFGLALGILWEVFEWATHLIGEWTDTWTDAALTALGATLAAAFTRIHEPGRAEEPNPGTMAVSHGPTRAGGALGD
ncbi:hypothetical protein [Roseomonas xinghualingensis]|uniref:hypothetical protein n=1 Tax=Roseomonas xinghualingensis TaxID=2986475 RepID=UPI0021F22E68|nr:hypothetical protein [Roseomonas sp. SXEYE001]MCV4208153.1 hypothetical protein [Roseomonas sp. SXEYE001]